MRGGRWGEGDEGEADEGEEDGDNEGVAAVLVGVEGDEAARVGDEARKEKGVKKLKS